MYILSMNNVSKSFGRTAALKGLSLNVRKGVFGLIGPNGAGKTTVIKILLDLVRPDEGEATVLGFDCQRESMKVHGMIGALLEKPVFPSNVTAIRLLRFVGRAKGLSDIQALDETGKLLKWVGLEPFMEKEIEFYSTGMRQRLGLAQALMGKPELVMLDEFTANLDPLARARILSEIRRIYEEYDVSFFISSHILPELEQVCDQIGILHRGALVAEGDMREMVERHTPTEYKVVVSSNMLSQRYCNDIIRTSMERLDFVEEVRESMGAIIVKVREAGRFYEEILRVVQANPMELKLLQPIQSALERIYETKVGEQDEEKV